MWEWPKPASVQSGDSLQSLPLVHVPDSTSSLGQGWHVCVSSSRYPHTLLCWTAVPSVPVLQTGKEVLNVDHLHGMGHMI